MGERARILHVNDDAAGRYFVRRVLERAGSTVLEATSGKKGLTAVREHRPDVVVLDVRLADMSGDHVCAQLEASPKSGAAAVIQISATLS